MEPSPEQIAAREEMKKCEQEIQSIKAALRKLGDDDGQPNSMEVVMLKVRGGGVVNFLDLGVILSRSLSFLILKRNKEKKKYP